MLTTVALGLYVVALAAAGVSDLIRYEIPNALSIALVIAFALMATALPAAASAWHLSAGLVVLALASGLFVAGVIGGGDAKLLAATALWMGWRNLLSFVLLTALAGALIALILLITRRLAAGRPKGNHWYSRVLSESEGVPYGLAISAAGLASISQLSVAELSRV